MRSALRLAAALALGLCACHDAGAGPTKVVLGRNFTLRVGENALVEDAPLTVSFEGVASDSRCPTDVTCVWAGDAVARVKLRRSPRDQATLELHTQPAGNEAAFHGYEVRLVELAPRPRSDRPVPAAEYRATLVVTRP